MSIELNYSVVFDKLPILLEGCVVTLEVSSLSLLLGMILGTIGALCRISSNRYLRGLAFLYVWVIRGTPFLVQLFILYFGLATLGFPMSSFAAGVIGLGVNSGAYIAEIVRSGIQAVDKGQSEAAVSLGMTTTQSLYHVITPQAIKICIPSLVNQFIMTLKNSSIVSLVTIAELFHVAERINAASFRSFEVYTTVALLYLIMNTFFMVIAAYLEKRMVRQ